MEHATIVRNPDGSVAEYFDVALVPGRLEKLFRELFEDHWCEIIFGPCIQGAVFEIRLTERPKKITMLDGYLTVDTGPWHFHLCIDEHKQAPTPELARQRQVSRAVFFHEIREKGMIKESWGLRLWNGLGEQMLTIFFPNPYLTGDQHIRTEPDWSRLALWERLRETYSQK
ncbi:MAG: hypothetical protein NZ578_14705 [Candidatus Binatia bacterium]|nr:hypothetical protein [Candidatus Binatia bacterium]